MSTCAASTDGTIRALAGNPALRRFTTERNVTDAGLRLLHEFPVFKIWRGIESEFSLMSFRPSPVHLMIDGPFTDAGLSSLAGLDGVPGISFIWHCPNLTSSGLAHLRGLPNLEFLGCQGRHCDDEAMRQGTVASNAGFVSLGRSQTQEYFWGREAPNFGNAGLMAFATMPALLPGFPALRQLMPMDSSDDAFRHVGRCRNLEKLWCMYCRETGDAATEHLTNLTELKFYYAGMTKIADRSLDVLAGLPSLEEIEFWQCAGIMNEGVGPGEILGMTPEGPARLTATAGLRRSTQALQGSP